MGGGPPPPEGGPEGGGDELGQAIGAVIEAARSVGFELPQNVPPDQLPQVYQQLLGAAAKSQFGSTPMGMAVIGHLAQQLGVPSPLGDQQQEGQDMPPGPDQMQGGGMPGGMPPPGGPQY